MTRVVKEHSERREEIIGAACQLFLTKGYEKTTMQDVMETLKIAKGTIYHYFRSKEELLDAVVESMAEAHLKGVEDQNKQAKGDALTKIRDLISAGGATDDDLLHQLHQSGNEALHTRLLGATLRQQAPLYAALIKQGCEEGVFQTEAPLECAEFIIAAVQFLTDIGIYPWSREDLARRAKAFPHLIEACLRAPAGSFQFLAARL